jgi:hypothetical protein
MPVVDPPEPVAVSPLPLVPPLPLPVDPLPLPVDPLPLPVDPLSVDPLPVDPLPLVPLPGPELPDVLVVWPLAPASPVTLLPPASLRLPPAASSFVSLARNSSPPHAENQLTSRNGANSALRNRPRPAIAAQPSMFLGRALPQPRPVDVNGFGWTPEASTDNRAP